MLGTSPHVLVKNESPLCDDTDDSGGPEFPSFGKSWCCDYFLSWNQKQIFLKENKLLLKINEHHHDILSELYQT